MKIWSPLLSLAVLIPSIAAGQDTHDEGRPRISAVLHLGTSFGGPASGLADDFRQAGYDDSSPCFFFCSGSNPHPTMERASAAVGVTVRLPVGRSISVGGGLGRALLGGSAGYRSEGMDYIFSRWTTSIAWMGLFWTMDPGIRFGGGPARYGLDDGSELHRISRMGLVGELGLEFPANRVFFLDLAARLNLVPAKDVDYATPEESTVVTLRPTWTHVQLQAGFGVHL